MPAQHDKKEIKINWIPISVICNKYDLFAKANEPVAKKLLCSALRYICHKNGADLIFSSINETTPLKIFKNLAGFYTFKDQAAAARGGIQNQDQENEAQPDQQ